MIQYLPGNRLLSYQYDLYLGTDCCPNQYDLYLGTDCCPTSTTFTWELSVPGCSMLIHGKAGVSLVDRLLFLFLLYQLTVSTTHIHVHVLFFQRYTD
jgi:hypothetical protein